MRDCHLFSLALLSWLGLFFWFESSSPGQEVNSLFSLIGCGAIALLIFKLIENAGAFCVVKKQSDAFVMTLALIFSTGTFDFALRLLAGSHDKPIALVAAVTIGLFALGCLAFAIRVLFRYERLRRVALYLTKSEREALLAQLRPLGIDKCMQFLSCAELKMFLRGGAVKDIDLVVLSREAAKHFDSDGVLLKAHIAGVPIVDYQEMCCKVAGRVDIAQTDLSSYLFGATEKTALNRAILYFKYLLEPAFALLLAIVLLPLFLAVIVLIKLTSPGPVFYLQTRSGYMGRPFKLVKFRSMRVDAESNGPRWCTPEDPRITPVGSFLRRTRLDEIPQLWNVIKGEMSFIGPRPERPEMYEKLKQQVPLFSLRTLVRPGITGWAQVSAGYAASPAESLLKLEYDLFYIQHMSLRFDFYILLLTAKTALVGDKSEAKNELLSRLALIRASQSNI